MIPANQSELSQLSAGRYSEDGAGADTPAPLSSLSEDDAIDATPPHLQIPPKCCDPSHQLSAPTNPAPIATPDLPTGLPPSNLLDSQESTVRKDFDRWMHEKGTPDDFFSTPALDTASESSRFRHSGWATTRQRIWDALQRTHQNTNRQRSFGECGSYSWIEQSTCDCRRFRIRYNHCHDRLCTPCATARSHKIQDALMAQINGKPVSFITLTLKGKGETLSELVDRLYKHFRALRLHPTWAEKVRGGAAFLEIKYNDPSHRWHPHLHIIADADFIDKGILSDVWRGISKDSFIVDISRVRQTETTAHYVTKYASKPLNTSFSNKPELLDEAIIALKGRRLCLCFGTWYGTSLTDAEDATLDEADSQEEWKMFTDLESLLHRARSGDRDAISIIHLAGGEARWRQSLLTPS